MMRIGVLTAGKHSLPSLYFMLQSGIQTSLVLPQSKHEDLLEVEQFAHYYRIPLVKWTKKELVENLPAWLALNQLDVLFVITFPYIFPSDLIRWVSVPLLNFHFTPLPEYGGAQPIFWLIKNGERNGGISVHELTEEVDAGLILHFEPYAISDYETFGSYNSNIAQIGVKAMTAVIQKLEQSNWKARLKKQQKSKLQYWSKPTLEDVQINWQNMKSQEIINLCRACNPWNKGAITNLNGGLVKLIELSLVKHEVFEGEKAGTIIIKAEEEKVYVSTIDKCYLSIQIAYLDDGFYSSEQLIKKGLVSASQFQT